MQLGSRDDVGRIRSGVAMTNKRSQQGVYGISGMSELSGVGPQTLRLYERRGLLAPTRTAGGTRRYSDVDLNTLDRITALIDEGVNVVGVRLILSFEAQNALLEARLGQFSGAGPLQRERRLRRE